MPSDPRLTPENLSTIPGYHLNPALVVRQNVDQAGIDRLKALHAEMDATKGRFPEAKDAEAVRALVADVARIEYLLQDAWGFPRSAAHHTHWRMVPGCKCPARENALLEGFPHRIVADGCPIHSTAHARDGHATIEGAGRPALDAPRRAIGH